MKYAKSGQVRFENMKLDELKKKSKAEKEFNKNLMYVQRINDLKREERISKAINDNSSNQLKISLVAGKAHYFNFKVFNPTEIDEVYQVVITPEFENLKQTKLTLISNHTEWKSICRTKNLMPPKDFNIVSVNNYFQMSGKEETPLCFKLVSMDTNTTNIGYTVWITKKTGQPLYQLKVTIVKVFEIIDNSFFFSVPAQRTTSLELPNPFPKDVDLLRAALENSLIDNETIVLKHNELRNNLHFKYKADQPGFNDKFRFYVYTDLYRSELQSTWLITIKSLEWYIIK